MKTRNGFRWVGLFAGAPYGDCDETIDDYRKIHNTVEKSSILNRLETLSPARTSAPTYDLFTGERFGAGLYQDGEFLLTTDFVRYYKNHDIGIPLEYEEYLVSNNLI